MIKVLIVEDEKIIQKGLCYLVNWPSLGCTVTGVCSDGQEGLAFIRSEHPDLVLTDVRMPIMGGIEMLNTARTSHTFESIIISGYDDFAYASQAIRLDACAYILKPIDQQELRQAVEKAIERLQMRRRLELLDNVSPAALLDNSFFANPAPKENRTLVDKAVGYITDNYQKQIQTADICKALNISKTLLNQRFKETTGHTVNSFVNRYRITKALELMHTTSMSLSEIASAVGYSEYRYFFEVFRKYLGVSPSAFVDNTQKIF